MKIAQINVGHISVPPKGWGAIEEVIWNYKCCMESSGHVVDIRFPGDDLSSYDIVHVHICNQALMLAERGVPYIFTAHDVHALIDDQNDPLFTSHLEAIDKSLLTIVPGSFAIDYFRQYGKKIIFLQHGVNTSFFTSSGNKIKDNKKKLLCVGKNHCLLDNWDRKGFIRAIEAAKSLNLPLTIAGPNETWFEQYSREFDYPLLTVVNRDIYKEDLKRLYDDHGILLHLSFIETGQPCLVILEALSMGLPVVATRKDDRDIGGTKFVDGSQEETASAIRFAIDHYDKLSEEARKYAVSNDWHKISLKLIDIYNDILQTKTNAKAYDMYWKLKNEYNQATEGIKPKSFISSDKKIEDHFLYTLPDGEDRQIQMDISLPDGNKGSILYKEIFQREDYKFEQCRIEAGDTVIDIGANIGIFSRYAYLREARRVLSFEPEPHNFRCLKKNKPPNCSIFNLAVSDKVGMSLLHIDSTFGGHSILDKDPCGTRTGKIIPVGCVTIDYILDNICYTNVDFLKMDIEGSEINAFKGFSEKNFCRVKKIAMEFHTFAFHQGEEKKEELILLLKKNGFRAKAKICDENGSMHIIYAWR